MRREGWKKFMQKVVITREACGEARSDVAAQAGLLVDLFVSGEVTGRKIEQRVDLVVVR